MRRNLVRNLRQRQYGQTMLLFVLFMVVLFLFAGLGIDLGFAYVTRARLSKAVDSACLAAVRNIGAGTVSASAVATNAFFANYGVSGRDVAPPVPQITFTTDIANNNISVEVKASVTINTFFIRALPSLVPGAPSWKTLTVGSDAMAQRQAVVLTLVLDRSGSMQSNGGQQALPPAVTDFMNQFDDQLDRAAMVSFASAASTDVAMEQPFKDDITNAANALVFGGSTCSERGLTNAVVQQGTVVLSDNLIKAIVFFTDGMANTFYYPSFSCGPRNVGIGAGDANPFVYDPATGNGASCSLPSTIPSIDGVDTVNLSGVDCVSMHLEAERRAGVIASQARSLSNIVYCVGLGDPNKVSECGFTTLNPTFLKELANTTDSDTFNSNQPVGDFLIATNAAQLGQVFEQIASKILYRLSK